MGVSPVSPLAPAMDRHSLTLLLLTFLLLSVQAIPIERRLVKRSPTCPTCGGGAGYGGGAGGAGGRSGGAGGAGGAGGGGGAGDEPVTPVWCKPGSVWRGRPRVDPICMELAGGA